MPAAERIVKHLRVRAHSAQNVRHAVLKLEDAMRCATLPHADTRVLLVRQLHLGRIAAGASSQQLSRLMEQRLAAGAAWVHGADANAATAGFVYFRDALEARSELAGRLARALPCDAWFWPLAVAEFSRAEHASENLRRIAFAIAVWPEAPAALPAWLAQLAATGLLPQLARALTPADGATLLHAAGLPQSPYPAAASTVLSPDASADANRAVAADSRPHAQSAFAHVPWWLQTLARAGGHVPCHQTDAPAASKTSGPWPGTPARHNGAPVVTGSPRFPPHDYAGINAAARRSSTLDAPHRSAGAPQTSRVAATPSAMADGVVTDHAAQPQAMATACGGLLFVLSVMQRLNFAQWNESRPGRAGTPIARFVLALVLQRLRTPPQDPAWRLVYDTSSSETDAACEAAAREWLAACRRWLRRVAGIGIASLVVRPAAIEITPTHADMHFLLNDTDLRVRRAGLDNDPGWLEWYGRVVRFHYAEASPLLMALRGGGGNGS